MRFYLLLINTALLFQLNSISVFASGPFPSKNAEQESFLVDSPFQNLVEKGFGLIPTAYEMVIKILSILLIAAVIWMAASFITKNPQWMQWSKTTLLSTFITLLIIRLTPILFLTNDVTQIKLIINKSITLLMQTGVHASIAMLLIAWFIHFLYIMHENPAHYKWARSMLFGSIVVLVLSLLLPNILSIM